MSWSAAARAAALEARKRVSASSHARGLLADVRATAKRSKVGASPEIATVKASRSEVARALIAARKGPRYGLQSTMRRALLKFTGGKYTVTIPKDKR